MVLPSLTRSGGPGTETSSRPRTGYFDAAAPSSSLPLRAARPRRTLAARRGGSAVRSGRRLASAAVDPSDVFGGASSLARTVDLRSPSNRFALLAAALGVLVGAVATLLLTDLSVLGAIGRGLAYGVTAFLAWSIGRELDPDDPRTARYGVFAYAVTAWTGPPALAATVAVLLAARIVSRTSGRPPTRWDLAAVVVVAAVAALSPVGFVTGLALAYALYADTRLPDRAPEVDLHIAAAATAVVTVTVSLVAGSFWSDWRGPDVLELLVLLATLAVVAVLRIDHVDSTGDYTDRPVLAHRVMQARVLTLVTAVAAILWTGAAGVGALAGVLAAILAIGIAALAGRRPVAPRTGPGTR